jgi:hypothetical protein
MGLQYGIKEVLDLTFLDFATSKPSFFINYAEASSNEVTGERLDLRGGKGNAKQMSFDHTKDSNLQLTVPIVDLKLLALLTGEDLVTGAADVFKREILTVAGDATAGYTVTLSQIPISGTINIFHLEGLRDHGADVTVSSVSSKTVTVTGAVAGDEVVAYYQYATAATAKKISVKANKFPKAVKIFGTGLARNQEDEQDYACHVIVHKARPQLNMTFTMSGTEATNLQITFDMYEVKDANGNGQYIDYVFE